MDVKSRMPRCVSLGIATALVASGALTSCSSEPEQVTEQVYCTNEQGQVIDEDYCDDNESDGHGGGFIWIGGFGGGYRPGQYLPADRRTSSMRYNDTAARERAGLPRSGKVTGPGGLGSVTRTKATTSKGGGFGGSKGSGSSS